MNIFKIIGTAVRVVAASLAGLWAAMNPLVQALIVLMVLDIATGVLSGYVAKKLSSDVSLRGVTKKALILLVIGAAAVLAPHAGGIPLVEVVAGFYVCHEGLSILENLAEAGLPIPDALKNALAKVNGNGGDTS